jgi:hypothetical protein
MPKKQEEIGYIKYQGKAVIPGVLDAGKAGSALVGLDEALRFFNVKQSADLADVQYDVPVRVRAGSWEAIVVTGLSVFAVAYLGRAANEMAKKDWEGVGFKDIFSKSLHAIIELVRLAKHAGRRSGWLDNNVRWRNDNAEIGIPNAKGTYKYFPAEFVRWYMSMPPHLIGKIARVVEEDRSLLIGVIRDGVPIEERITIHDKHLFVSEADIESDEEYLFPELEHGAEVVLEGRLTRGNASTNSIGLEYRGHILNCIPNDGSIVKYKKALFLRCRVVGRISRAGKANFVAERRPTIIVSRIVTLEHDRQRKLF